MKIKHTGATGFNPSLSTLGISRFAAKAALIAALSWKTLHAWKRGNRLLERIMLNIIACGPYFPGPRVWWEKVEMEPRFKILSFEGEVLGYSFSAFHSIYGARDGYACRKCFKLYFTSYHTRRHEARCRISFNRVERFNNVDIATVDKTSPLRERMVCENIAEMAYLECGWDFMLYRHNYDATCFVAFCRDQTIGYMCFRKIRLKSETGEYFDAWALWDVWIAANQRRKGYATMLFRYGVQALKISLDELFLDYPFTKKRRSIHQEPQPAEDQPQASWRLVLLRA